MRTRWLIGKLQVGEMEVNFKLDTGAQSNVLT